MKYIPLYFVEEIPLVFLPCFSSVRPLPHNLLLEEFFEHRIAFIRQKAGGLHSLDAFEARSAGIEHRAFGKSRPLEWDILARDWYGREEREIRFARRHRRTLCRIYSKVLLLRLFRCIMHRAQHANAERNTRKKQREPKNFHIRFSLD